MKQPATTALFPILLVAAGSCGAPAEPAPTYVLDEDTQITLLEGFDAELIYDVPKSQGSWVAMDFDEQARLVVSDQDDKGVFRVTLTEQAEGLPKVDVQSLKGFPFEPVAWGKRTVAGALGFKFAFDSLYMSTMKGFYRVRDTDGDDQFDEFTLLKKLYPGWEHSAHTIIETADGEGLYLISGNHSRVPDGVDSLQPPVWKEDALLPSMRDPRGHATSIRAPGGWLCRVSPDGSKWTMVSSGFRNAVDMAINKDGELFTYDSDLEFDVGSPWYRPTRINHVTSASEFGWRTGSTKWPDYFPDSVGSVIDMGPGSPTGISFAYDSTFPTAMKDKLFVCDWTFGTIYMVTLEEDGSSYQGSKQEFLHGAPLNISAMRFGPDGHMYFLVGGRNTDSKLYRVRYVGDAASGEVAEPNKNNERELRRSLEALHGKPDAGKAAVDTAWTHLGSSDRGVRYAARLAIECQSLEHWQDRVFRETVPRTVIHGVIALCRHGDKSLAGRVIEKLATIAFDELERDDQLALLRAWALCLIRLDQPTQAQVSTIIDCLDPFFPAGDKDLDTELCRVLSHLDAPNVVGKTVALMDATTTAALDYDAEMLARHEYGKPILESMANAPNSQNIHYAYCLRRVQNGWTLETRKRYFSWLKTTLEKKGGQSFEGYVRKIREDAIAHLPADAAASIAWLLGDIEPTDLGALPMAKGPPKLWTTDDAMKLFDEPLTGRDFDNGKNMFAAGRCIACHRFRGTGGHCGPDLGSVGNRFTIRDIVTSICEPNHTIAEQYQASLVHLDDGNTLVGRIIYRNDEEIAVACNAYDFSDLTKAASSSVKNIELSPNSMMPPGLLIPMNGDEVRDLLAYLVSGGNKQHAMFQK